MERRLWILALFAVVPVLAQETLTIDEAIQRAVRSHPLLSAQSQRVAAARGLVQQAGLRPNPRVYFQSENWSLSGADPVSTSANADQFAYFTQPIELGGKRQRRIELSQVNLRITSLEEELVARQIASRVSLAYWAAVGAQRVRSLWVEQLDNFRQTTEYHEVRVREGALAESELLRVRLEADRFSVAAASAALDAERARIALFQAMGEAGGRLIVLSTPLDSNIQLPPVDMDRALRERTELKMARQDIERAGANLRLQNALAKPDIEAGVGYERNFGFNTMLATVQFNLPLFNKNQGNIGAASSDERAARSNLTAAEMQVRSEVAIAQSEAESKRRQLVDLLAGSRARASESAQIASAAYREGGADLLRLLDAQRLRIDLEVLYAKTLTEYRQSIVALETALGNAVPGANP